MKNLINRALAAEKKILFLMAMVAVVLSMASCGDGPTIPDEPGGDENITFAINVSDTGEKTATVTVTPSDNSVEYIWWFVSKAKIDAAGSVENYLNTVILAEKKYGALLQQEFIATGEVSYPLPSHKLEPNTEYVVYAFLFDEKEDAYVQIRGKVATKSFKTKEHVAGIPAVPTGLKIVEHPSYGDEVVKLTWDPVPGATSYNVYVWYQTYKQTDWTYLGVFNRTQTESEYYCIQDYWGDALGATIRMCVSAVNNHGESEKSEYIHESYGI